MLPFSIQTAGLNRLTFSDNRLAEYPDYIKLASQKRKKYLKKNSTHFVSEFKLWESTERY